MPGSIRYYQFLSWWGITFLAMNFSHTRADAQVLFWGSNSYQKKVPSDLTNAVALASGANHTLALRADGKVVGWGSNTYGETDVPATLSNVTAIAAGDSHSLALTALGTVGAWGKRSDGLSQLPAGLNKVIAIAAGTDNNLALTAERRLVVWGSNAYGQTNVPVGLTNIMAIAAGAGFCLALDANGRVWAWGRYGTGLTNVPVGLSNVVAIAAGASHALALLANGTVMAWGTGSLTNIPQSWTNLVGIAATSTHNLAVTAGGQVLAAGSGTQTNVPVGLTNVLAVAAGSQSSLALTGAPLPVIVRQPGGAFPVAGGIAAFQVLAAGRLPLVYQWRAAGTNLIAGGRLFGANTPTMTLTGCGTNDEAEYSVVISNSLGGVTSAVARLALLPSLSDALSTTGLTWTTGGSAPWFPEREQTHDGVFAACSGAITNEQTSWIQASVAGPVKVSFWWKVSSENCWDYLVFYIDGVQQDSITGESDWKECAYFLDAGAHTLQWSYIKDELVSAGEDRGWLDEVAFTTSEGMPVITVQPGSRGLAPGQSADLSVLAGGTQPLAYQWFKDETPIVGATSANLPLLTFQATQAGVYRAVITNVFGSVTSQQAVVTLTPVFAWGDDAFKLSTVSVDLTNVLAVACGSDYTAALRGDGTVVAWGSGHCAETNVPGDLNGVVAIATSSSVTLALRSNGTVVAWGQWAPNGTWVSATVPKGLSNVVAVSCGVWHALALQADGRVVAWGADVYGDGVTSVPSHLTNCVSVAAGIRHNLVVRDDGTLYEWGRDWAGQSTPPTDLGKVISAAANCNHNVVIRPDGTPAIWGANNMGQTDLPAGISNVVAVACGTFHSLALRSDGTVAAWGYNSSGQTDVPPGLRNAVAIAGGYAHSVALIGSGPPVQQVAVEKPSLNGTNFSLQVPTQSGRVYALEYKNDWADRKWIALPLIPGNGHIRTLTDTSPVAHRFYRVRSW